MKKFFLAFLAVGLICLLPARAFADYQSALAAIQDATTAQADELANRSWASNWLSNGQSSTLALTSRISALAGVITNDDLALVTAAVTACQTSLSQGNTHLQNALVDVGVADPFLYQSFGDFQSQNWDSAQTKAGMAVLSYASADSSDTYAGQAGLYAFAESSAKLAYLNSKYP